MGEKLFLLADVGVSSSPLEGAVRAREGVDNDAAALE